MFPIMTANTPSGYFLQRSLRFRRSATAYLSRTNTATPTSNKTWTISAWVKRGTLSADMHFLGAGNNPGGLGTYYFVIDFPVGDTINIYEGNPSPINFQLYSTQVFRDPSAWYHIVLAADTTQATASSRLKLYVNGVQVTSFTTANYPSQNSDLFFNQTGFIKGLGNSIYNGAWGSSNFDGYITEVNFIDGQALTPSSFGSTNSTTGVWQPAPYTGTYGTNGFYLPFTDNSALTTSSNVGLGKDFSGNGNYWTTNNISLTAGTTYDSMTDVPTLTSSTAANFAVLNTLVGGYGGGVADGNLRFTRSAAAWGTRVSTILAPSGKYYFEVTGIADVLSQGIMVGVSSFITPEGSYIGVGNSYSYYSSDGRLYANSTNTALGATYNNGDVIGVAIDLDAGTLKFYKNNTQQGSTITGLSGSYYFGFSSYSSASAAINYGQQPFTYTPPSGFVALNAYNLPDSTIKQGNKVMDATLYTGNGSTQTITNAAGFKPDYVWAKQRNGVANWRNVDSVRGTSAYLFSSLTNAEVTDTNGLTAFNSNGFSLGANQINDSGATMVAYQWQAGQGSSSSNTNGTITSTVSVNASAGFSVVTYTGTGGAPKTVGHGLGVAPSFIVVKQRNAVDNWVCYHSALGATQYIYLNVTNAAGTASTMWDNTAPTSSVFTLGSNTATNGNGTTMVAYCWSEIAGFSKFGSYTGNGSTDGPFVYTGFRPKFVLIKSTSNAEDWHLHDTSRDTYNLASADLYPDSSSAEVTIYNQMDILSNGFKLRSTNSGTNGSGYSFVYACFAENPFKNSLAR